MKTLDITVQRAGLAAKLMAVAGPARKNSALRAMADQLEQHAEELENALRIDATAETPLPLPAIPPEKLAAVWADELRRLAALPDPVGEVLRGERLENGLTRQTVRAPLGAVAVLPGGDPLFMLRASALLIKTGNAGVLGGDPADGRTAALIPELLRRGLLNAGLPADALQTATAAEAALFPQITSFKKLFVREKIGQTVSRVCAVPCVVIGTPTDHLYAAADADPETVVACTVAACSARPGDPTLHTLLLHRALAEAVLPPLQKQLAANGLILCGEEELCRRYAFPAVKSWRAPAPGCLCVRLTDSLNEALALISVFGSGHAAGILTRDHAAAQRFVAAADVAVVSVNTAPVFGAGDELGEPMCLGLSAGTDHGPVGLAAMTALKCVVTGNGQAPERM